MNNSKLSVTNLKLLEQLLKGERIASSRLKGPWIKALLDEHILVPLTHGSHVSYAVTSADALRSYLQMQFGIADITSTISMLEAGNAPRAQQVAVTGDSKTTARRTMFGFLVNSYEPIRATLRGSEFTICPQEGSFVYIYDFNDFRIPANVTVVGMENAENFRCIERQRYLFEKFSPVLFVSRYPQSTDLVAWLRQIDNNYLHFGDFDLAGINIYLTEFYNRLGNRARFFVPDDIEHRLKTGSTRRFDTQYARFSNMPITDERVTPIVQLINKYHRGYDQEGFILP